MNIYPSNFDTPFKPKSLADYVISDTSSRKLLESIVDGKIPFPIFGRNGICLWGINGSGKSTLALMLPQLIEQSAKLVGTIRTSIFEVQKYWDLTECGIGKNSVAMLSELDARCKNMHSQSPSGWHYEILDEVDLLTPAAQASLKAAITFANSTIFILTTNHPSKLDIGIKDRCHLIEMNQPQPTDCISLGQRFFRQMGLTGDEVTPSVFAQLAKASRGSIREFGVAVATLGISYGGVIT
jgi:DNA polymerase III delta prime subunit